MRTGLLLLIPACFSSSTYSAADVGGSSLTVLPAGVLADGHDSGRVQLTLRTHDNRPLVGFKVTFSGSDCTFTQPAQPTDANGVAQGAVRSLRAGTRTLAAQVAQGDFTQTLTLSAQVEFLLPAQTAAAAPNQPVTVQLVVVDPNGAVNTGYAGTVHFVSSDPNATLPPDARFDPSSHGQLSVSGLILRTPGVQTVTAIDNATGLAVAQQQFIIAAGPAVRFEAQGAVSSLQAGNSLSLTLLARDAYDNLATGYLGTVRVLSTDPQAQLPADIVFTAQSQGTAQLGPIVLRTAGAQTVSLGDVNAARPSAQVGVQVTPALAVGLRVDLPASAVAGVSQTATVVAQDAYGNLAPDAMAALSVAVSDPAASAPANSMLVAGSATLAGLVWRTSGAQLLTVGDSAGALGAVQLPVQVSDAGFARFAVQAAAQGTAGTYVPVTARALDAFDNLALSYHGTARFVSSDTRAVLPADHVYVAADAGSFAFVALVYTAGAQTLVVADSTQSTLSGSATVNVVPAAPASLDLTGVPASLLAGTGGTLTLTAHDAYGNVTPSYQGTAHVTSTDPQAQLPADTTLAAGDQGVRALGAFALRSAGAQTLQVTDGTLTGAVGPISVRAAAAAALAFVQPVGNQNVCVPWGPAPTVRSVDAFGNPAAAAGQVVVTRLGGNPNNPLLGTTVRALDANGVVVFADLRMNAPAAVMLVARMADGSLTPVNSAPLGVGDVPLQVTVGAPVGQQGCIAVPYTTNSRCPVDVRVDVDAQHTGTFVRATQAAGDANSQGVSALVAPSARFAWNSSREVHGQNTTQAQLRVTVRTPTQSASGTVSNVVVSNGPALSARTLSLASAAACVGAADLNNDGAPDLVACSGSSIARLAGAGTGLFASAALTAAGLTPVAMAVADVNRDGKVDVLAAGGGKAALLAGDGAGGLVAGAPFTLASNLVSVALADINRDGRLDLIGALGAPTNAVEVWLQNSAGAFPSGTPTALTGAVRVVRAADMNRDGKMDAVVLAGAQVQVLLGSGSALGAAAGYATASGAADLTLADVNRDGQLDAVTVGSGGLSVLLGSASGALAAHTDTAVAGSPSAVAVADVNRDGALDALIGLAGGGTALLLGNGAGGFTASITGSTGASVQGLALVDADHDGLMDVATADASGVTLLRNATAPPCSWDLQAPVSVSVPSVPVAGALADFNGDGRVDAALVSQVASLASVLLGDGAGAFRVGDSYVVGQSPNALAAGDFNGDGRADVLVLNTGDGTLSALLGDGNGHLSGAAQGPFAGTLTGLAAGDMDNDGALDAVVANGAGLTVLRNRGDANFTVAGTYGSDANTTFVTLGDLDGDGDLDAVALTLQNTLRVYLGNNTGALTPMASSVASCGKPTAAQMAQMDSDALQDVVVTCDDGVAHTNVYRGDGSGGLTLWKQFIAYAGRGLVVGDYTGDGNNDLLVGAPDHLAVGVSNGSGTFTRREGTAQVSTSGVLGADLNGDGVLDAVSFSAAYLTGHLGDGSGTLGAPSTLTALSGSSMHLADFNHDGQVDLLITAEQAQFITSLGDGAGGFTGNLGTSIAYNTNQPGLGDLDRDGWTDTVAASDQDANAWVYLNTQTASVWGARTGLPRDPGSGIVAAAVADMNLDGVPDVLASTTYNQTWVFPGQAGGGFAAPYVFMETYWTWQLFTPDLNHDGYPDVLGVSAGYARSWISVKLNDGTGHGDTVNGTGPTHILNQTVAQIAVADFNHDGQPDLVMAPNGCPSSGCPYGFVAFGTGTGDFTGLMTLPLASRPATVGAEDLNGDGNADIWFPLGYSDYGVSVLFGDGHGGFSTPRTYVMHGEPVGAVASDFNRDGVMDMVASDNGAGFMSDNLVVRLGR